MRKHLDTYVRRFVGRRPPRGSALLPMENHRSDRFQRGEMPREAGAKGGCSERIAYDDRSGLNESYALSEAPSRHATCTRCGVTINRA